MNILFIHQNFPAQYIHIAQALTGLGHKCIAIGSETARELKGITLIRYSLKSTKKNDFKVIHPWAVDLQVKCLRAEAVAINVLKCKEQGFNPDLIIGHPGWGELLAIKDIYPKTPVLNQLEFIYQMNSADNGFDPESTGLSLP